MSPDIVTELYFLLHSFLMGIVITVLYDLLRILRRVIPHNILAISIEDLFYWITCALLIFAMLIRENNGVLRWFAVAGAMVGMVLYKITLGFLFVKYVSFVLQRLLHLVCKIFKIVMKPLNVVKSRVGWTRKKSPKWLKMGIRRVKKKLTDSKKLLKIILCKQ